MTATKLKDNIYITGFNDPKEFSEEFVMTLLANHKILYAGKTEDIPKELIRDVCELQQVFNTKEYIKQDIDRYRNYQVEYTWFDCTAKQSIKSACPEEYCIIYKKKK